MIIRHTQPSPKPRGRRPVLLAVAAVTTAVGSLAIAGTARADQYGPTGYSATTPFYTLNAENSSLAIDVSGASTVPGAPIIQWYDNGGNNQHWQYAADYQLGPIINENSGMCITTDGVPGDQLVQMPCVGAMAQEWLVTDSTDVTWPARSFYNPYFGLEVDVYGDSPWAGATIDAWYPDGQSNQTFVRWDT